MKSSKKKDRKDDEKSEAPESKQPSSGGIRPAPPPPPLEEDNGDGVLPSELQMSGLVRTNSGFTSSQESDSDDDGLTDSDGGVSDDDDASDDDGEIPAVALRLDDTSPSSSASAAGSPAALSPAAGSPNVGSPTGFSSTPTTTTTTTATTTTAVSVGGEVAQGGAGPTTISPFPALSTESPANVPHTPKERWTDLRRRLLSENDRSRQFYFLGDNGEGDEMLALRLLQVRVDRGDIARRLVALQHPHLNVFERALNVACRITAST